MTLLVALLSIIKILTVALGGTFLAITCRAYRRRQDGALALLLAAVILLTIGAVAEGLAYRAIGLTLADAHTIEAIFTVAGFASLVGSVAVRRRSGWISPKQHRQPRRGEA